MGVEFFCEESAPAVQVEYTREAPLVVWERLDVENIDYNVGGALCQYACNIKDEEICKPPYRLVYHLVLLLRPQLVQKSCGLQSDSHYGYRLRYRL